MLAPLGSNLSGNLLLDRLSSAGCKAILKKADQVALEFGDILIETGQVIRHVYFPISGFISLVSQADGDHTLEVGLIGNDGMLGCSLLLGVKTAPLRALVQGTGVALRLRTADFLTILTDNQKLDNLLRRYLYVSMTELAQASVCTRFHVVEARLARWLLMTHDCAQSDQFQLKHEFLAEMLGVRRSGITIAAGALQRQGLIRYSRGTIDVLDRAGLKQASCECYGLVTATYQRLISHYRVTK